MTLAEVIDEHFLTRYRVLLDAEDTAFDELEHAYEDGDRAHWEADLEAWRTAIQRRMAYLARCRVDLTTDGHRAADRHLTVSDGRLGAAGMSRPPLTLHI